jgi:hypothetical protein
MVLARAGPEHAERAVELLVGDSVVVRDAAAGGLAELVEDLARGSCTGRTLLAQPPCEVAVDRPVVARAGRRRTACWMCTTRPSAGADDALLLLLQAARQHHVGVVRGLGEEEVDHPEELQLVSASAT